MGSNPIAFTYQTYDWKKWQSPILGYWDKVRWWVWKMSPLLSHLGNLGSWETIAHVIKYDKIFSYVKSMMKYSI